MQGSLLKPEYKRVGSLIPYLFHDINSFADLFYCAESKRFIAVTLFRDEGDRTHVQVYSLYSPPINAEARTLLGSTYENFCKEYKFLYGDDFDKSFNDILSD